MIESPPKIRKEDFDKALRLSCDPKIADVVNEINRQYQYWTEIKYKHLQIKCSHKMYGLALSCHVCLPKHWK